MTEYFQQLAHEFRIPFDNPVLIFSLILFIILLSPILLKKLNIPGIIGLIISGVIIGPYGLGILENDSAIRLFSTIGILYIMFIAGLELDMNQFKANKNKSILFGFITFVVHLVIGFPVCFYLLKYDFNASALIASMLATHTLVAYPIVSKLGIAKNEAVAITVGGTILVDTVALIVLAVIMGNHTGSLDETFWITLGISLAIFSAIIFYLIPKVAKWFFQKLESEKHAHYIFVLAVVFFAAFLAEVCGLEPIIGAFMAGLALNRLIPHSSALMNRIEFIGNSLFIPFFLISVGMLVDISVLLSGTSALIITVTLVTIAVAGKWISAFFTQLIYKYTPAQRQLIFGLSTARAAATLAIVLVGYEAGILGENVLNAAVILILVTCIISSFATEKPAKQIAVLEDGEAELGSEVEDSQNERILVPIANISNIEKLIDLALYIKDKKSTKPVFLLSVVPNDTQAELNIVKSRKKLDEYVKHASASEINVKIISTIDHNASSGITRAAREIMANIIMIGWPQRHGVLDKLVGRGVESIINNADKSIYICSLEEPLVTHKRIFLITPPLAERELGFESWLDKVTKLADELTIPIVHYGDEKTQAIIENQIKSNKMSTIITHNEFSDWESFLILSREIAKDDLLVMISSRKGSVSYTSMLQNIPSKLEKYFSKNNKIIIYPKQSGHFFESDGYDDVSSAPISKGIESFGKLKKGLGDIFK